MSQHEHMHFLETVFLYGIACEKLDDAPFDGRQSQRNRETLLPAMRNLRRASWVRLQRAGYDCAGNLGAFWKEIHRITDERLRDGTVRQDTTTPTTHDQLVRPQVTITGGTRE